jgi:protein-disulfide isomerase
MLDHGDRSFQAHQAAECAGEQGQFWPMHDAIFENQRALYGGDIRETLKGLAGGIGLESQQFNSCLDEQRYAEVVQSQDEFRRMQGVRTRPTFDINGQLVVGPQGFAIFENIIDTQLMP